MRENMHAFVRQGRSEVNVRMMQRCRQICWLQFHENEGSNTIWEVAKPT